MLNKIPKQKGIFFFHKQMMQLVLLLLFAVIFIPVSQAQENVNDHMFPALAAAKPFIDMDNKGFIINGKRTFLVSAGLEYARIPHELWKERLLQLKRGGFNCIEIYTLWNFHEPQEGKFQFSGDQNLDQFLSIVQELGMYSIVRVGPYYCAEWDHGGYPIWLRFKPGLRVREDNPEFEKYVDRFFDRLLPIVFKHQINKGGSVVLVQLENEHPKGWGTDMPDPYFKHLQSKALSLGLEVPYFFSGVHHSSDPAGNGKLDDPTRPNPWFSTEFWSVWYNQYGAKPKDAAVYGRRTWKVIAHGGSGYNFYMAHGGSNFAYTNNDEDAASYDYGAAVGQSGDLRPTYFTFKRAGYFARSFQEILENSSDATKSYQYLTKDTLVKITARTSPAGTIVFLDNPGPKSVSKKITINKNTPSLTVNLAPGEIYPLVHQFKLNDQVTLDWGLTRIYGVVQQNNTTTILVQAAMNKPVYLSFLTDIKPQIVQGAVWKISGRKITLNSRFKTGNKPAEYLFKTSKHTVRILVMDTKSLDKTWWTEDSKNNAIVTGASYLGNSEFKGKNFSAEARYPLNSKSDLPGMIYLEKGSKNLKNDATNALVRDSVISFTQWENKDATIYSNSDFNDASWKLSENPLQMGADGDVTASTWYRTQIEVPTAGKYTLQIEGGDRGTAFVDGKFNSKWNIKEGELTMNLDKGTHTLAIFTAHDGRDKMVAHLGPIDDVDKKGLAGIALLKIGGPFIKTLENWKFTLATDSSALLKGPPSFDSPKAKKYKIGADAFNLKVGYGWFQTIIPAQTDLSPILLKFKSTDEDATIFINSKKVLQHKGWNIPFEWNITDPSTLGKPILLSVFIANFSNEGGIDQPVKINTIGTGVKLTGWRMKGGVYPEERLANWKNLSSTDSLTGPQFYRSTFKLPAASNQQLTWRVNTKGLGHGSVWVNGHNLGRYPEKLGAIGMYIPLPWLKKGNNEILIYDEDGNKPVNVNLSVEKTASSVNYQINTSK
jgi:beta-galactosidase